MNRKIIFLLIGQKGSGKSFIGAIFEKEFGIKFIRVEDWVKEIKKSGVIYNEIYLKQAFEVIEHGIRNSLNHADKLVFESTGLTDYFDQMFQSLKKDFQVSTIGIYANSRLCLERVNKRDQTIHINISDDQVSMINEKVKEKDLQTNFRIDNEAKAEIDLIKEIRNIIQLTENQLNESKSPDR